ncbi:MAG: hypothetical protein IAE89_14455 [Anaerolineae bacterium]|nr:hypothetical protein [Anaerolineae bacterium]
MDENQTKAAQQLLLAFKSLQRSVEKGLLTGIAEGAGTTAIRSYVRLQERAKKLLPDDFFIGDVLILDVNEDESDNKKLAQVNLLSSQAVDYLEGLDKASSRAATGADFVDLGYSLRDLGQEIQDQVMNMTRKTLKRAVANIDINDRKDPFPPMPPAPPHAPAEPEPPSAPSYSGSSVEDPLGDNEI